ncbi:MAG: amino acid ABC transporter substrate-binding protein [Gemmatimonadaceae bacterium]|nr:amino acid ABC transporter substrate-binding protein [Acetobacteraceae bacterium]
MQKFVLASLTAIAVLLGQPDPAAAQQAQSRLFEITKAGRIRVCVWPLYYSIAMRDPKTGELVGIDADLSKELAKDMGVRLEYVETSFGTFIADLQANKCEIGMFGVGATMKRAQAAEFSRPYLITNIYAVMRDAGPVKEWADIDKKGINVVTTLGSYIEPFMRGYLKNATLTAVAPPATTPAELMSRRADVIMTDFPSALRMTKEFEGTKFLVPPEKLAVTPYAYVVPQGDQIWLNYVNLFVDTIKIDGRLAAAAARHGLGPIVAQ